MTRQQLPGAWHIATALLCLLALHCNASVPADLTNFQNEYPCDAPSLVVRPTTLDDVAEAVRVHAHVKANGEGHSWNQPFFCVTPEKPAARGNSSGSPTAASSSAVLPAPAAPTVAASRGRRLRQAATGSSPSAAAQQAAGPAGQQVGNTSRPTSANIVLTTLRPLTISVNESDMSVWVDAGVKTTDLLQYLSNYVTPDAPAGYTLGAFPWFVYQSIGGAVATGTHGSNLGPHKSLSNQVLAVEVVLANGTRKIFTNETDPFLMKALRVSVGKLGILGRLKFHIVKEVPVHRSLKALSVPEFLELMQAAQDSWSANGTAPAWMNETQVFWLTQWQKFMLVGFTRADSAQPEASHLAWQGFYPDNTTVFSKKGDVLALGELVMPADAQLSVNESQILIIPPAQGSAARDMEPYSSAQKWLDGFMEGVVNGPLPANLTGPPAARTEGVPWSLPAPKAPAPLYGMGRNADMYMNISRYGINIVAGNATAEATRVYIKQPALALTDLRNTLYDQYEVSIPLAAVGSCWKKLSEVVYGDDLLGTNETQRSRDKGFRTAPLIRFIGAEDGLLSHTHDGPRMYINIEDYTFYNANRTINKPFKAVMAVLTGDPACTSKGMPRLHWGKAGWPDKGCWHGDKMYGDNWCHFGCAVKQLDPTGKFSDSAADRWTWAGVDLEKCCGEDGFKVGAPGCVCQVQHERVMSDCPPAPFYTSR